MHRFTGIVRSPRSLEHLWNAKKLCRPCRSGSQKGRAVSRGFQQASGGHNTHSPRLSLARLGLEVNATMLRLSCAAS